MGREIIWKCFFFILKCTCVFAIALAWFQNRTFLYNASTTVKLLGEKVKHLAQHTSNSHAREARGGLLVRNTFALF